MRVDQFLNTVNIVKSRQIAKDMCEHKAILINDIIVKGSKTLKEGDVIKIVYLEYTKSYKVLLIPTTKNTKKSEQNLYIKEID